MVTLVGEGEPTLYQPLGDLIEGLKARTEKPVAVITNGALLYQEDVSRALRLADLVLPSLDAWDEASFRAINRPHGSLRFNQVLDGLVSFSKVCQGQLWLEIMLMEGVNDDRKSLLCYAEMLKKITYDRLYLNTPVRPPAEPWVRPVTPDKMLEAADLLGGLPIDFLASSGFTSDIPDDYQAILSIIRRHPMNQYEIESFLADRGREETGKILSRLEEAEEIEVIDYKGYRTFRLK